MAGRRGADPAAAMRERELQAAIERLCVQLRLLYYHPWRSEHSTPGWPDLVIVAPGRGALYVELKREGEQPTAAQAMWLAALESVGCTVVVWRPSDLLAGRILARLQELCRAVVRAEARELVAAVSAYAERAARERYLRRARLV